MYQFDMYDYVEKDKWSLPIRICELYGGIGSQRKALDNLGIKIKEHYLVEVDINATISYAAIHCDLNKHLDQDILPKEIMIAYLDKFNWRSNETAANLSRLPITKLHKLFVAQRLTRNLGDVTKLNDLPAVDLITWSTPCQDFSIAGSGKGFTGDKGGLTFITLNLFRKLSYKPTFLLFENVPAITNKHFIGGFNLMLSELESLGYTNHVMRLNAKDYGVPQNRDRVYVLSVKNDHPLQFQQPKKIKLTKMLRDFLDEEVDEKFWLTDKQLEMLKNIKFESMGLSRVNDENGVCNTINTMGGGHREPKVARSPNSREYKGFKDISPTLCARDYKDPSWVIDDTQGFDGIRYYKDYVPALRSSRSGLKLLEKKKIRKITPLESWRLMGFDDQDFIQAEKHASNTTLYKQAGNSIVVQVLESIFENIFTGEN